MGPQRQHGGPQGNWEGLGRSWEDIRGRGDGLGGSWKNIRESRECSQRELSGPQKDLSGPQKELSGPQMELGRLQMELGGPWSQLGLGDLGLAYEALNTPESPRSPKTPRRLKIRSFVRDGIHSVADYNSTRMAVVVVVVVVVVYFFTMG